MTIDFIDSISPAVALLFGLLSFFLSELSEHSFANKSLNFELKARLKSQGTVGFFIFLVGAVWSLQRIWIN